MQTGKINSHAFLDMKREKLRRDVDAFMAGRCVADFDALACEIFAFQMEKNAPYRRYAEFLGQATAANWREIPALPTDAYKLMGRNLRCFAEDEVVKIFRTSGTTRDIRGEHWLADTRLYEASLLAGWRALGLPDLANAWFVSPSPQQSPDSSLVHMFETLRVANDFDASRWLMNGGRVDWATLQQAAESGKPLQIFATALALWNGMEAGVRIALPAGSWILETGGYKGVAISLSVEEFRARVSDCFGVPPERILNEYGMTELSSPFYAWGNEAEHRGCPWVRVRVRNPESGALCEIGEPGYLEILDLANLDSVVAIRTQDIAIATGETSFRLLGRDAAAIPRGCSRGIDEVMK